jgi:hypothetical protein
LGHFWTLRGGRKKKEEQLITKLVKDFPGTENLDKYSDHIEHPTKASASALITMALETNWDAVSRSDGYMKYIATRPRAERLGRHGLFGDEDSIELDKAMAELGAYTGNVWTHIISLQREDAVRLGYDNAQAWRNLVCAHRNGIAAAMKIPPNNFRWYAAFHDEGDHPHIHIMAWSVKLGQAYLSRDGIRQIKSKLTNDIFKFEMVQLYEQKSESRDELVRQARRAMLELTQQMRNGVCNPSGGGKSHHGAVAESGNRQRQKTYGYLPKPTKKLVDEIVDQIERVPVVRTYYERWLELQGQVDEYYSDTQQSRLPLSAQKEFRAVKNAVIKEAECIRRSVLTFEGRDLPQRDEPEDELAADRCL